MNAVKAHDGEIIRYGQAQLFGNLNDFDRDEVILGNNTRNSLRHNGLNKLNIVFSAVVVVMG